MNFPSIVTSCQKFTKNPIIVLRDKGNSGNKAGPEIRFNNSRRSDITILDVDGCAISGDEIRCDYGVFVDGEFSSYVELKGSDISHAINQIKNTIRLLGFPAAKEKYCFIRFLAILRG